VIRRLVCLIGMLICAAFVLSSCTTIPQNAVPNAQLASSVRVFGPTNELAEGEGAFRPTSRVRWWGDEVPSHLNEITKEKYEQMKSARPRSVRPGARPTFNFLAISGGGADGAFGAGLLNGWSASGKRPEFEIVTGISTGALSAPFAFLGPKYDPQLKEMYTAYTTRDMLRKQPIKGILGGDGLASSAPLARLIAKYADQAFLEAVAKEHRKGRRLLVGTTNIDAQRPVVWDMGAIAASGQPSSLDLFRKVLLASASIPGAFPSVKIKVYAEGQVLQEQHVDGGTTKQVFLFPGQLELRNSVDRKLGINPRRRLYIIRNGRVKPEYKIIESSTLSLAKRSISTLIKYQGIGDLYQLYVLTRRNGIPYRLAVIPGDFKDTSKEVFDRTYMNALYDLAFGLGKKGYRWTKVPPGMGQQATAR